MDFFKQPLTKINFDQIIIKYSFKLFIRVKDVDRIINFYQSLKRISGNIFIIRLKINLFIATDVIVIIPRLTTKSSSF